MEECHESDFYCSCDVFKVSNKRLHLDFEPYAAENSECYLYIKNISDEPQELCFEPPRTSYFLTEFDVSIRQILPKHDIRLKVKCEPFLGKKSYYDRIEVACKKGCATVVKLFANPFQKCILVIPREIHFGTVALGEVATRFITLEPVQDEMVFIVLCSSCVPGLTISPMKGVVNVNRATIEIRYRPEAYVTVSNPIHIYIPSLSHNPYYVNITADTKPGYMRQIIEKKEEYKRVEEKKKFQRKKLPEIVKKKIFPKEGMVLEKKKLLKDEMAWTQHHVNKFLLEKEQEVCKNELRDYLWRPCSYQNEQKRREEENFMREVDEMRRAIQSLSISKKKFFIDGNLNIHEVDSKFSSEISEGMENIKSDHSIFHSFKAQKFKGRILIEKEDVQTIPTIKYKSTWFMSYLTLNKFIEAVRTVCIHNRLLKRLEILKTLTKEDVALMELTRDLFDV